MPKVGGVEFPYTKKGMQKAKAWSEMIGKPIKATPMPKKKGQKSKAKPMPKKKGSVAKATPMKYENGGWLDSAQVALTGAGMTPGLGIPADALNTLISAGRGNWGDAGMNLLAMVPGLGLGAGAAKLAKVASKAKKAKKANKDWQKAKDAMIKAGRKDAPATGSTIRPDVREFMKKTEKQGGLLSKSEWDKIKKYGSGYKSKNPAQTLGRDLNKKDIAKLRKEADILHAEATISQGQPQVVKDVLAGKYSKGKFPEKYDRFLSPKEKTSKILSEQIDFAKKTGAPQRQIDALQNALEESLFKSKFAGGGQIPQETLLRAMYALGGEIPAGRRMYGMGKKKKSLQTADVGPVRGMKKGGKVKYHV